MSDLEIITGKVGGGGGQGLQNSRVCVKSYLYKKWGGGERAERVLAMLKVWHKKLW